MDQDADLPCLHNTAPCVGIHAYHLRLFPLVLALAYACVFAVPALSQVTDTDQDLRITLDGSVEGKPEGGKLTGVCGTDDTRNLLTCDIYNGLVNWTITEIVVIVTWSPYEDANKRFYRVPVTIQPLRVERASLRLGLQLPADSVIRGRSITNWSWLIAGARGQRLKE